MARDEFGPQSPFLYKHGFRRLEFCFKRDCRSWLWGRCFGSFCHHERKQCLCEFSSLFAPSRCVEIQFLSCATRARSRRRNYDSAIKHPRRSSNDDHDWNLRRKKWWWQQGQQRSELSINSNDDHDRFRARIVRELRGEKSANSSHCLRNVFHITFILLMTLFPHLLCFRATLSWLNGRDLLAIWPGGYGRNHKPHPAIASTAVAAKEEKEE